MGKVINKKLVRDKIPEIIRQSGVEPTTRILDADENEVELRKKLNEEVDEYLAAETSEKKLGELADIQEVLRALAKLDGFTPKQVEGARLRKAIERGGFEKRIYLIETNE